MAPKPVKLTSGAFGKDIFPQITECVLKFNPQKEENVRKIFKKFIRKCRKEDGILLFAHQDKDKLSHLIVFKQECKKAGIKLSISLYCEDKNPYSEDYGKWFAREVDIALDDNLNEMIVW